jgi:hypothetical protein
VISSIALIPGLILAALAGTASDDAIRAAVKDVYTADEYQLDMTPPPAAEPLSPEMPAATPPISTPREPKPELPGTADALGPAVEFLFWTIVVVGLTLLGTWVAREWAPFWPGGPRARIRKRVRVRMDPAATLVSPVKRDERPEFERHAEEGRYDEAVHVILLALQWEIGRRRADPFPRSLTSREILRRARLDDSVAETFGRVVTVVEGSLFGGDEVGAGQYEECAGHYRSVLSGLREAPA